MTAPVGLGSTELGAGCLLVASPEMLDPNFNNTVVFVIETNDEGALGVVINRPSAVLVADLTGQWVDLCAEPEVAFHGGPVGTDGVIALARLRGNADAPGVRRLVGPVCTVDLDSPAQENAAAIDGMRLYAGYAGWGAGQLEGEIERGDWYVVPGRPDDLFLADVSTLRRDVLRRQPGDLALHSTRPADADLN